MTGSAFAYTELQPIKLNNGLQIAPQINANNAAMAEQQGCDYQVYSQLWNNYSTTVAPMLNNTDGSTNLSNIQSLSQGANTACLSGPLGQISNMAGSVSGLVGVLSGDLSAAKAMSWATQQATQQACSLISNAAGQAINQSGAGAMINGASNIVNTPLGPMTNGMVNGTAGGTLQNIQNTNPNGNALQLVGAGGSGGNALNLVGAGGNGGNPLNLFGGGNSSSGGNTLNLLK